MPSKLDVVTKTHFDEVVDKIQEKLDKIDKLSEQMDWLVGSYRNHEEEHTLLNGKVSEHSDEIEAIKEKLHLPV